MNLDNVASERVFVRLVGHRNDPPFPSGLATAGRHRPPPALTAEFDQQKTLVRGDEDASERVFGRPNRMEDALSFPTVVT